jgi:hypothetical protein
MTRILELLGPDYDAPARLPTRHGTDLYEAKRGLVLAALRQAESRNDAEAERLMFWELGLIDLTLGAEAGVSPYGDSSFERYAGHYRLSEETTGYARERAAETSDIVLKLQYLEYILLRIPQHGRERVDLQRELLSVYRSYVDSSRVGAHVDGEGFVGLNVERALIAMERMLTRPGVVRDEAAQQWAAWLVGLAEDSRAFPVRDPSHQEQYRHRWVGSYLSRLVALPAESADSALRARAIQLLDEATTYYQSTPLNDELEHQIAEHESALRKHWGEDGMHERATRRKYDALVRRAKFHRDTGNGMLTAHYFRAARRLVEEHRQYFSTEAAASLQRDERAAHAYSLQAGEYATISIPFAIPVEHMDYTCETAEETISMLLAQVANSVPDRLALAKQVDESSESAVLSSVISRTVVGAGKVVGESLSEEKNRALDIEQRATLASSLFGAAIATTVIRASESVGLSVKHLLALLEPLSLDPGSLAIIERGCERFIAQDWISAMHILVPAVEDTLRQYLRSIGVDTSDFVKDVGDGTTRTDDATFGSLMRKTLPDARKVREYLGEDLWEHLYSTLISQTGANLRNEIAHGLTRPHHCTPENAGLVLSLLYLLALHASGEKWRSATPAPPPTTPSAGESSGSRDSI